MAITGWLPGSGAFGGSYIFSGDPGMQAYQNAQDPFIANNPHLMRAFGPQQAGPGGPRTGPPQVPGQITGAPGYGGSLAAGSIPRVPRLGKSMQQAISQNVNNLPGMQNLAGQVNQFNLGQVTSQFEQGQPGYQAKVAQQAANVQAGLEGLVNEDVRRAIFRDAAGWGAAFGGGGTAATERSLAGSRGLENLALTSMAEQQRAAENRRADLAAIPRAVTYDLEGKLITPQQQQAANLQANIFASLPDPEASFLRAQALANAGLGTGFGMGRFNLGPTGGGGVSSIPSFAQLYQPSGGVPAPTPQPTPAPTPTPTGPGWGYTVTRDAQGNPIGFASSGLSPGAFNPYGSGTVLPASASGNYLPASTNGMYDYLYA